MSSFAFRLQKVFEYRELEEGWAKDNFLAKHISRMEAENELFQLEDDRRFLLSAGADDWFIVSSPCESSSPIASGLPAAGDFGSLAARYVFLAHTKFFRWRRGAREGS